MLEDLVLLGIGQSNQQPPVGGFTQVRLQLQKRLLQVRVEFSLSDNRVVNPVHRFPQLPQSGFERVRMLLVVCGVLDELQYIFQHDEQGGRPVGDFPLHLWLLGWRVHLYLHPNKYMLLLLMLLLDCWVLMDWKLLFLHNGGQVGSRREASGSADGRAGVLELSEVVKRLVGPQLGSGGFHSVASRETSDFCEKFFSTTLPMRVKKCLAAGHFC